MTDDKRLREISSKWVSFELDDGIEDWSGIEGSIFRLLKSEIQRATGTRATITRVTGTLAIIQLDFSAQSKNRLVCLISRVQKSLRKTHGAIMCLYH